MKVRLEEVKQNPNSYKDMYGKNVFIWSEEHKMWWRPNSQGYTTEISDAGVYKFEQALATTFTCGTEKGIWFETLPHWHKMSEESTNRPTVVCLCGSTRFKDAFEKAAREETLSGKIVLTVGLFGHLEGLDMSGDTKKMLDNLHLRKIDLADEILVLNVDGYIGQSTSREIQYATSHNKNIRYLESLTK